MATSPNVVISQAYGGGGNTGSTYKNDFIELFNHSSSAVDLTGWSVQYASAAGTTWTVTTLSGSIPAYGYYLVKEAVGAGGTTDLPTADATGNIAMGATGFKVALCNFATAITSGTSNPVGASGVIDFIGSGTANAFEGAVAPTPSAVNADIRASGGCTDTDNNSTDFTAAPANPHNSSSPANNCGGGPSGFVMVETKADGTGVVVPSQSIVAGSSITVYAIQRDASSNFVANVAATSWGLTKSASVSTADLVPAGDSKSAVFTGHGAGTAIMVPNSSLGTTVPSGTITVTATTPTQVRVETAADGTGTVVPAKTIIAGESLTMYAIRRDAYTNFVDNVSASSWSLSSKSGSVLNTDLVSSGDLKSAVFTGNGQGTATVHASSAALAAVDSGLLTITSMPPAAVVISQIYGGGGNSSPTYMNDYVELFNRTANPVDITGWSIQYGSPAGGFNNVVAFTNGSVSIAAHTYYLIKLGGGTNAAGDFTADITNTTAINLGNGAGKVALVNTSTALGTITWPDARVADLIGYGSGASIFEGTGVAPAASDNATAVLRVSGGCVDTDNNNADFATGTPNPRNSTVSTSACAPNAPTISSIGNQSEDASAPIGPIGFNVNDAETPAANLTVTATSSNPTLLPNNQITLGGAGIVRNVTLNPVSGQTGSAVITITVTDGDNMTASTSFYLFVGSGPQLGILFSENFDEYADGTSLSFANNSPWFRSSGTNYELIVSNMAAQVSLYLTNSEDLYAPFLSGPFTATSGDVLYVGFTVNQTVLPTVNGDYFLHLRDATGTNFAAKVFAGTGTAASGKFRLGVSNRANSPANVEFPMDLSLNTTYNVVVRYKVSVGSSTIWVNPSSPNDVGATATDPLTPFDVTAIGIRESGSPTTPTTAGSQVLDSIVVSTSMSDVTTFPVLAPTISATRSGNSIVLSWPTANNSAYALQTAGTVNATTWSAVNGVTVSGNNYTITIPFTSTPAYFRLKQ